MLAVFLYLGTGFFHERKHTMGFSCCTWLCFGAGGPVSISIYNYRLFSRLQDGSKITRLKVYFGLLSFASRYQRPECSIGIQYRTEGCHLVTNHVPHNSSFHSRVLLALIPIAQPINPRYLLRNTFAAQIRPRHRPQRHKRSRMLPREPDPPLRATFPQRLNILVQLHLPIPCRIARLKRGIRAEACKLVVLPVRGQDPGRVALGGRGGITGQQGKVWAEEGVEARHVFLGG